ncbi:MAG: DUF1819 domain-containing protein [Myxococcales bacterium]|nr:DUF1819 domain-containing protein [Myxococcales bacterium]
MNPQGNAISIRAETQELHTRLLKCALEVNDARAYWQHAVPGTAAEPQRAFNEYWFGARSLARVEVLLANMRARFDAFPHGLRVLTRWGDMSVDTRNLVCHWHLQLSDPLYRAFTGDYLVTRRAEQREQVTRDLTIRWVSERGLERWTMATRIQFASKLLSSAFAAGLVGTNRDPRPLTLPRVPDEALEYLLYALRQIEFAGSLTSNPYLSSVGLEGADLENRLYNLPSIRYSRQSDLVDFGWRYPDLEAWARVTLGHDGGGAITQGARV